MIFDCNDCLRDYLADGTTLLCPFHKEEAEGKLLSPRHYEIAHKVALGKPNKIIAFETNLAEGTVKEYMNQIFERLGLSNRVQVALWYLRRPIDP